MKRPWPVSAIAILYFLGCLTGTWDAVHGKWISFLLVPIYAALAFGLWQMREWARRGTVLLNGFFGTIVLIYILYVSFTLGVLFVTHPLPQAMKPMAIIVGTAILLACIFWGPFIYLRQLSVRKQFEGLGPTV